jgi:hypothetical protein
VQGGIEIPIYNDQSLAAVYLATVANVTRFRPGVPSGSPLRGDSPTTNPTSLSDQSDEMIIDIELIYC